MILLFLEECIAKHQLKPKTDRQVDITTTLTNLSLVFMDYSILLLSNTAELLLYTS